MEKRKEKRNNNNNNKLFSYIVGLNERKLIKEGWL